jgi:ABC-type dipeptide/oligopeptide/nickel transport system ATPase component
VTLLYVHRLSVADAEGHHVLDGVSFHLDPGQVLGIAGGSGAGKRLLCDLLSGARPDGLAITEGRILLGNRDLAADPWQNDGTVAFSESGERLRKTLIALYDNPTAVPEHPVTPDTAALVIDRSPAALVPICDEIAILCAGRLVEHGPAQALVESPRHPYTEALIAADGTPAEITTARDGCPYRPACRHAIDACATTALRLQMTTPDHATACARRRDLWPVT